MSDDRARDAAEAMQTATLQAIAAGRALLDLLEEAVQDPGPLLAVVAATLLSAQEAARTTWERVAGDQPGAEQADDRATDEPARSRSSRVQHIRIS